MSGSEVELLRAKLEASELRHEVRELRSVVEQYQRELGESNRLLLKQRLPPRPHTNSTENGSSSSQRRNTGAVRAKKTVLFAGLHQVAFLTDRFIS